MVSFPSSYRVLITQKRYIRMKKNQVVCLLTLFLLVAGNVSAALKPYTLKEAGLQFEIPDGWKVSTSDKNGLLQHSVSSADEEVVFFFVVAEDAPLAEKLWGAYLERIKKEMKDVKSEGQKQDKFNGMEHLSESGTGEAQGVKMEWSLDVLAADRPVLIFSIIASASVEKHGEAVGKLLSSMKHL